MSIILSLKVFLVIYHKSDERNNLPEKLKQLIQSIDNNISDCTMTCYRAIPYIVNNLKRIHLNSELFDEFSTTFSNNKILSFVVSSVNL